MGERRLGSSDTGGDRDEARAGRGEGKLLRLSSQAAAEKPRLAAATATQPKPSDGGTLWRARCGQGLFTPLCRRSPPPPCALCPKLFTQGDITPGAAQGGRSSEEQRRKSGRPRLPSLSRSSSSAFAVRCTEAECVVYRRGPFAFAAVERGERRRERERETDAFSDSSLSSLFPLSLSL